MPVFTYTGRFTIVSSGTCGSRGLTVISSKSECENALIELALNDTLAFEFEASSYPTGCLLNPNSHWLSFNTDNNNGVPCGSAPQGITQNCICTTGKFKHFHTWKQS